MSAETQAMSRPVRNKIVSDEVRSLLMNKLEDLQAWVIGSIPYDEEIVKAELFENSLNGCRMLEQAGHIVERLEQVLLEGKTQDQPASPVH